MLFRLTSVDARHLKYAAAALLSCLLARGVNQNSSTARPAAEQQKALVDSFELIWSTLRDRYWDQTMAGLNWQAIHDQYLESVRVARNAGDVREAMSQMLRKLPSSHLAIIPEQMYGLKGAQKDRDAFREKQKSDSADSDEGSTGLTVTIVDRSVVVEAVEEGSGARDAGVKTGWIIESVNGVPVKDLFSSLKVARPDAKNQLAAEMVQDWLSGPDGSSVRVVFKTGGTASSWYDIARRAPRGKLVQFGNLPPEHVSLEHRKLSNGVGYLRLNLFLDPVSVMPEFEKAIREFRDAPGVVLDLRNNPGGLGVMAMGLAGWFVSQEGLRLGTMTGRDLSMEFEINPRLEPYSGRLAILVNGGSASTTEILAQGLQDLGRARIFGTRTAGAALPSEIIELPDGDRFQYPEANYVSVKGRVLEGNGVQPDVVVAPTINALLAGRDLPLEAAKAWSKGEKPER